LSTDTVSAEPAGPEWLELYDPQTGRVVYANTVRLGLLAMFFSLHCHAMRSGSPPNAAAPSNGSAPAPAVFFFCAY
ncbi:hypothetical protein GGI23_004658, partial [Coemansia sp. RSA 2559]